MWCVSIGFLIYFQQEHISRDRVLIENKLRFWDHLRRQFMNFYRKRSLKKHTSFKSLKVKCADIEGSNKTTGLVWILQDTVFKKKKEKQTP